MLNDRISTLSLGIAAVMLAHASAAWLGWLKGSVALNLVGAAFVTAYVLFGRR